LKVYFSSEGFSSLSPRQQEMNSFFLKLYDEKTPRPLFLIEENNKLSHGFKIPFLKAERVQEKKGFS